VLLIKYYSRNKAREDEVGRAYSMQGRDGKYVRDFDEATVGKKKTL
jgi:hypothetical protein